MKNSSVGCAVPCHNFFPERQAYHIQIRKQATMHRSADLPHTTTRQKKGGSDRNQRKETRAFQETAAAPCTLFQHQYPNLSSLRSIHPSQCYQNGATTGKGSLKGVWHHNPSHHSGAPTHSLTHHCNAKKGVHEHIRTAHRMGHHSPVREADDCVFGMISNPVH